jgi:hypothetical protein
MGAMISDRALYYLLVGMACFALATSLARFAP